MQSDEQQIPDKIFSWLENRDFAELEITEQELVLQFFTSDDYQDMRFAVNEVNTFKIHQQKEMDRKNKVLQAFDELHSIKKVAPKNGSFIWRIAASLVAVVFIYLFVMWYRSASVAPIQLARLTDTVYITKEVPGESVILHDTVYKKIAVYGSGRKQNLPQNKDEKIFPVVETALQEMTTLPVSDVLNSENSFKGISMQEDSLWLKFSPVSL